jgi:putative aminopeptidase FrvX
LVESHAPSGHEGPIREVVRAAWTPLVASFEQDGLGSLIGIKPATRPLSTPRKIMLAAHMDEIGLMVRDIVDGFIYVQRIAGLDPRVMMAQPVLVHGRQQLPGVVATVPPHALRESERNKYPDAEGLMIDVGLSHEKVIQLVRIGDLVTPDTPLMEMDGDHVVAKAMDDRACVAIVTAALHHLQDLHHSWDVYAVATVQEETGLFGAATAAYKINPDAAIALDVTFAPQPGITGDTSEINGGPALAIGGNIHPRLYEHLTATAKKHEIKYQVDPLPGATGTDAWSIQIAREGIPTALLELPLRNMHSPVETASLKDMERAGRLLAYAIAGLDETFVGAIED